jgi:hypothetical protein
MYTTGFPIVDKFQGQQNDFILLSLQNDFILLLDLQNDLEVQLYAN